MADGWRTRPFRVKVGLGTGPNAGTFETVLEAPEWIGPYGSRAADDARLAQSREQMRNAVAARFPGERVVLLEATPIAAHVRQRWDRPDVRERIS